MTYIGNIGEMANILKSLSDYPGFERLQAEIEGKDWEQSEHTFAVAREAHAEAEIHG